MFKTFCLVAVFIGICFAEIALIEDRLTFDAVVSANARWQQLERQGFSTARTDFYRFGAPLGLTGIISEKASFRTSFDAGLYQGAMDLYVDLLWPGVIQLRAGQFVPPLGYEAGTGPGQEVFIERSIVRVNWKPWTARDIDIWDPRDVGFMLAHESSRLEVAAAIINGSGKTVWLRDTDTWKDICGRVSFQALRKPEVFVAARGYYGRMGDEGTVFRNTAAEAGLEFDRWRLVGEVQHAVSGPFTRNTFYIQGVYTMSPLFEPVFRFDASFRPNDTDMGLTPGLNLTLDEDKLRLMFNYVYRKRSSPNPENRSTEQRVLLQLQASL